MTTETELLAAIAADLDDPAPYQVYADWLLERGDPHGELIAIQTRLALGADPALQARERALLDRHVLDWLGPDLGEHVRVTWFRGFVREVVLKRRPARGWSPLLRAPAARFIRRISALSPVKDLLDLVEAPCRGHVTVLWLGSYRSARYSTRGLADAFPNLQVLDCDAGSIELVELRFRALRDLGLALGDWSTETVAALMAAEVPALETLTIWGTGDDEDLAPTAFRRLFDGAMAPALRTLRFEASTFGDPLVDALLDSRLLPRLAHVDLDDRAITDAGCARLLERAAALRHLTRLRLPDDVSEASRARLSAALGELLRFGAEP
jgi:uncharacterized protein (TIGR02996 family)